MKAVLVYEQGGPEVLRVVDIPKPEPKAGEVLIETRAAGVNFADTMQRAGTYPFPVTLPLALGFEVAGTVAALGAGVTGFAVGDRVAAQLPYGGGGYAEFVAADAATVLPLPEPVGFAEATAVFVQGLTAYFLLAQSAYLRAGESVLVTAAAGGVGSLAVQLARRFGAGRVIGVTSSPRKADLIRSLGADAVIDYTAAGWRDELKSAAGGDGPDVILESVGGATGADLLDALAPFGRFVYYGGLSGDWWQLSPEQLLQMLDRNQAFVGMSLPSLWNLQPERVSSALRELVGLVASGELRVVTENAFPLTEVAEAHRAVEGRRTVGKVVLTP
jgi:NADPH:quinone reductase